MISFFSFRISRKKMIQHDLKSYGPLRLFDLSKKIKEIEIVLLF
jgi:hypothetical protein